MLFDGRMGVVSGRYHSVDGLNGSKSPSTVLELFGRTEHGESICALVHGLRPTFEISPSWFGAKEWKFQIMSHSVWLLSQQWRM